jgi:hypothetical protein
MAATTASPSAKEAATRLRAQPKPSHGAQAAMERVGPFGENDAFTAEPGVRRGEERSQPPLSSLSRA